MAGLPTLSIRTTPFQFTPFQPLVYQQEVADKNILRQSMDRKEARRREATSTRLSYIDRMKGVRESLNPSEYDWFDNEFQTINDRMSYMIESGNSGKAIEIGVGDAMDFANSTAIKNKQRVEYQRNKWLDDAKKEGYDDITLFRMDKENPYYDNGTGEFEHNTYSRIIPLIDLAQKFIQQTPVQQNTKGSTTSTTTDNFIDTSTNKVVNTPLNEDNTLNTNLSNASYSTHTLRGGSTTITELTVDDMRKVYNAMKNDKTVNASLRQEFSNMVWLKDWCDKTLADPNASSTDRQKAEHYKTVAEEALTTENGFYFTNSEEAFKKWCDDRFDALFGSAAYRRVSTESRQDDTTNWSLGSRGSSSSSTDGTAALYAAGVMPDASSQSVMVLDDKIIINDNVINMSSNVKNVTGTPKKPS